MSKNYQTVSGRAVTGRVAPKKAKHDCEQAVFEAAVRLPELVTIAVADLADGLEEGVLAFAVP